MKLLIAYLRTYGAQALLCVVEMCVFALLHLLGGGHVAELRYALLLALALLAAAFCVSLLRFRRRMRDMEAALASLPDEPSALPQDKSPLGSMHAELEAALLDRSQTLYSSVQTQRRDAEEYFTLWLHQMKTPLAALDLMAQSDAPVDHQLMRQELLKARQYADMALTYQRLPSMAADLELVTTPVYPLCCACARQLMPLFRYGQIALTLEPFEGSAQTDVKWLSFVITQLMTNALKYTPPGGQISVSMPEEGVIEIRDSGIGIRAEDVPRVFDRGFTGLRGRTHEKSTGIGLYLCRQIMDRLGHGISLESELGRGTTVRLDLRRRALRDMG